MIGRLRNAGLCVCDMLGSCYARGVVPLRERPLMLFQMGDGMSLAGTATALVPMSPDEVTTRIRLVIGETAAVFLTLGVLEMRPHPETTSLVSAFLCFRPLFSFSFLNLTSISLHLPLHRFLFLLRWGSSLFTFCALPLSPLI